MPARSTAALLLVAAAIAGGCASRPQVRTDHDPSANLADYKTFAFFEKLSTDQSSYTTVLTTRLKSSTQRELERRGLSMVTTNPQLLVNFNVNIQDRADVESAPAAAGYYGYRTGMYGMWGSYPQDVHTTHYQQGTLAIDLVDAARRQLVWQGVAEGRISKQAAKDPQPAIDRVVTEIFAKYPVAAANAESALMSEGAK
jgi:hypothetical protein